MPPLIHLISGFCKLSSAIGHFKVVYLVAKLLIWREAESNCVVISNSPNCLPNDSHCVSLENLVLDQLVIP